MDICFARGTVKANPYVMATMNEVLQHVDRPEVQDTYARLDEVWNARAAALNTMLGDLTLPVRVAGMTAIWTTLYHHPSRYNWMFQYYLRAEGLTMSWIGTGRFIFSHDVGDEDFREIARRFVAAAQAMQSDGWWWHDAALTNKAIKRRVLKEMLAVSVGRGPSDRSTGP